MQGIKAIETRFFRSHMTGCDLSGALLLDCDLRCVDLTRARLTGAQILDSQFYWPNPIRESQPWYCGEGLSRSEEHTSELQSLMRISYAVFCLQNKTSYHAAQYTITGIDNQHPRTLTPHTHQ